MMTLFRFFLLKKTKASHSRNNFWVTEIKLLRAFDDTKQTRCLLTPVCPSSSLYPSSPQEEARFHPAQHTWDDAAGGAPGDPQRCPRLWMPKCAHVPGPCPVFRHPHHLRGALHQPGPAAPGHDRHQLVLRAPSATEPKDRCQKFPSSSCRGPDYGWAQ